MHSDTYFDAVAELNRTQRAADRRRRGRLQARLAPAQPARRDRHPARARAARARWTGACCSSRRSSSGSSSERDARGGVTDVAPQLSPADLLARVNRDVERSCLRARNGVRYVRGTRPAEARGHAEGRRLAARQGAAVALPRRPGPVRAAAADRHQPRQPQLHPRPAARQQRGRVPARRGLRRLPARLGRPGRARRRQQARDLRRRVPAARGRRRAAPDRLPTSSRWPATASAACSRCSTPTATPTRACATSC